VVSVLVSINNVALHWAHLLGVKAGWGVFCCVGWQVTLCDPKWQVMSHSSCDLVALRALLFLA